MVEVATYPPESIWTLRHRAEDPIAFLEHLAAEGDLVRFALHGHPAILVNHPEYVEEVLVLQQAKFAKPPIFQRHGGLLGTGLLTAEGDLHRRRRRAIQPSFSPPRLVGYSATVVQCVDRLLERWRDQDRQVVDMAAEMQQLTLEIIGRILFSRDLTPDAVEIRRALAAASASIDPLLSLVAPVRRLRPARAYLRTLVGSLIDERRGFPDLKKERKKDPKDDILALLERVEGPAEGPEEEEAASEQLRDDMLTLFVAGHDTLANGLTWTWSLLADHPDVEARLHDELRDVLRGRSPSHEHLARLPYTGRVWAESLRLYPPSWVVTRQALEEHKLGGTTVPAGAIVVVSQYLLHRDPRFFPDPLRFDPDRWDAPSSPQSLLRQGYIPFGAGPRSCIGQGLATMEGTLALAGLASHWRCRPVAPIGREPRATLRPRAPARMTLHAHA